MTLHGKPLAWVAGLTFCAASLSLGATSDSPYQGIVVRNVFGLKPPPPPPDPESLKPPASKITLTGIITIFGKKQAMMKTPPSPAAPAKPGQPAEPPKEHSYLLTEGQREDEITVLQIDEVAKTVKVDNAGHVETLMFSTNEVKTAAAPAPGRIQPFSPPGQLMPGGFRSIPRPLRVPGMGSTSATGMGGASSGATSGSPYGSPYNSPYAAAAGVNANGTSLNFGGGLTQPQIQNASQIEGFQVSGLSPEGQALLLEAERQRTASDVQQGKAAPLPITSYTPAGAVGYLPTEPDPNQSGSTPRQTRLSQSRPGMPLLPQ